MKRQTRLAMMWLALASLFGGLAVMSGGLAGVHSPQTATATSVAGYSAVPSGAPSGSSAPVWQGVVALDGLEGDWVGESGPAVNDGGVVNLGGATLRLDPMRTGRRWTLYESVGQLEVHCSVVAEAHEGSFPAACDKGKVVSLRFAKSSDGRLSIDNFSVVLRRP